VRTSRREKNEYGLKRAFIAHRGLKLEELWFRYYLLIIMLECAGGQKSIFMMVKFWAVS